MNPLTGTVRATQSDVSFSKTALAPPFTAKIVEVRVRGNDDWRAAVVGAAKTTFALPLIAPGNEIGIDGNLNECAHVLGPAITSLTFPSGAMAGVDRVSVRRRFNLHAGFADGAIAPIAAPTSVVAGLYCVCVRRNPRRYARCAIAPKAAIAFPGRPCGGQICVRWNFHRNTMSAVLVIAAFTFPTAAIALLACVIRNGGDRTLARASAPTATSSKAAKLVKTRVRTQSGKSFSKV